MFHFFFQLARGHFRNHRLEALLCLAGVGWAWRLWWRSIQRCRRACRAFRGRSIRLRSGRPTASLPRRGRFPMSITLRWSASVPRCRWRRSSIAACWSSANTPGQWSDVDARVARLVGVDVFSESAMRSFTQMQSSLGHGTFVKFMTEPGALLLVAPLAHRLGVKAGDAFASPAAPAGIWPPSPP